MMQEQDSLLQKMPNLFDKTAAQVHVVPLSDGLLYPYHDTDEPISYKELRDCSRHPLVKLALDLQTGELQGVPWRYEFFQDVTFAVREQYNGVKEWIEHNVRRIRDTILTQGIRDMLIYGFSPFEAIYSYNTETKLYEIKQLKPLLQEYTWILIDPKYGDFIGFEQRMPHTKSLTRIDRNQSFLMNMDVRGQNWYGTSVLEAVIPLWKEWKIINGQIQKFFRRNVGGRYIAKYPVGKSPVGVDGSGNIIYQDNAEIAQTSLTNLVSEDNFGVALPHASSRVVDQVGSQEMAWEIVPLADTSGNAPLFIDRQRQIEELMVNAMGMPVRMFQEGRASGSRAELESFTDIACTIMESRNHYLAYAIQEQIINHLTLINFGIEHLIEIQVGNVKQSKLFFERHPGLDASQQQNQIDSQVDASEENFPELPQQQYDDDIQQGQDTDPQHLYNT